MHRHVYHNGSVADIHEVRLSPGQSGLFNGWGIFTTLLVRNHRPFAFERHWNRLQRDAALVRVPLTCSAQTLQGALADVIRANDVSDACARIYVIHNTAGPWHGEDQLPETDVLVCTGELPSHTSPAAVGLQAAGRHAAHPLAGAKVTSWLHNLWPLARARERGFHEAILLNERGEVAECTAANVFCRRKGRVETPPLSSGCLAGVTREILLEIGPAAGVPIVETTIDRADLLSADEVFISSTSRGVLPVARIEDHDVACVNGDATRRLAEAFALYVDRYCGTPE